MSKDSVKLYRPKQIILVSCSLLAGIGCFFYRRYYENGRLTNVDLFATVSTLLIGIIIVVMVVRKANREE